MKIVNKCKKCGKEVFGGAYICHNCKMKITKMGSSLLSADSLLNPFKRGRKK